MDTRRKVEINELIEKRGNDFGGGLVNMNPTIAYQEIMKSSSDQTASQTEDSEYQRRLPDGAVDSKPGTANAGTKVSGSLERYAAAAQFTEKTQSDVGSKSLEEIKEALRSRGAFDKVRGSK
jgi:anti-sigma28 factor (negative regulator of flagellin synthesis)